MANGLAQTNEIDCSMGITLYIALQRWVLNLISSSLNVKEYLNLETSYLTIYFKAQIKQDSQKCFKCLSGALNPRISIIGSFKNFILIEAEFI